MMSDGRLWEVIACIYGVEGWHRILAIKNR